MHKIDCQRAISSDNHCCVT